MISYNIQKSKSKIKTSNPMKPTYLYMLIVLCSIQLISGRQLQVPVIRIPTQHQIKLGRLQEIKQPDFDFKSVQSRQVFKADGQMTSFQACHQNKPQVQFQIMDKVNFQNHQEHPYVIYKFQDIQYSQYLLDTFVDNNTIYMIFQDAMVATAIINSDKTTKNLTSFTISGLEQKAKLQVGYFVKVGNDVVFVNNKYAILVGNKQASKIEGYTGGKNFVTVVTVQDQFIAIGYEDSGVVIYKYANNKLQHQTYIAPQTITESASIQLTDLAYYSPQKTLLILDQNFGITTFAVSKTSEQKLQIQTGSTLLKRQSCDMMSIFDHTLYLVCNQVYRVSLNNWPRIDQKTLPHPNIKIREIYVEGPLVAFVGRNIFKLMYLGRLVNYFQDQRMDKLIFRNDLFISANQGGLLIGKYAIVQPYITCQAQNQVLVGSHPLIFKTVAECSKQFFTQFNIQNSALNSFTSEDTCVYTVERTLYFWKTGEIAVLPIIIALSVLVFIALTVVFIWVCKKCSIQRFKRQLEEYTSLKSGQPGQNHQNLVQELPESGNNKSGASNNMQNQDEEPKPQTKQYNVEMQNHDIE